ncbi:hypothetical protein ACEWAR_23995, partial [Vibrio parahaemolyticus]
MSSVKHSNKKRALVYLGKANEYARIYSDILKDRNVGSGLRHQGVKSFNSFSEYIQQVRNDISANTSTLDLLNHVTYLLNRLSQVTADVDDAIERMSHPLPVTESMNLTRQTLFEETRTKLVDFRTQHRHVCDYVRRAHWHLISHSFLEFQDSLQNHKSSLEDLIQTSTNDSIREIKLHEQEAIKQINISSRSLDIKLDDIQNDLSATEEKIIFTARELMKNLDKNFAAQQSSNLEAVTNQTRTSVNDIQLASQEAANKFHKQVDSQILEINNRIDSQVASQISEINSRIEKEVNQFEAHKLDIEKILGDISNAHQSNA